MNYSDFFCNLTKKPSPYPWQQSFSQWNGKKVAVVSAPTGAGKEFGAVVPWLYGHSLKLVVPSRLIYCLPTRSLVDQVYSKAGESARAEGILRGKR